MSGEEFRRPRGCFKPRSDLGGGQKEKPSMYQESQKNSVGQTACRLEEEVSLQEGQNCEYFKDQD